MLNRLIVASVVTGVWGPAAARKSALAKPPQFHIINRVTIAGFTGKEARNSSTQNGRSVTKLSVATTKRYQDADGNWQEKTQWHTCVGFASIADRMARIQTGSHVFIEGELSYREYDRTIETENGPIKVQWPVTELVVEAVTVLDRKRSRKGKRPRKRPFFPQERCAPCEPDRCIPSTVFAAITSRARSLNWSAKVAGAWS